MSNSSAGPRTGACVRETAETSIRVRVRLDGHGVAKVTCPVRFHGHMLEQIARHGRMDLEVEATGDVEVDAHHTVEDVGIALGQALRQAIAGGAGLARAALNEVVAEDATTTAEAERQLVPSSNY